MGPTSVRNNILLFMVGGLTLNSCLPPAELISRGASLNSLTDRSNFNSTELTSGEASLNSRCVDTRRFQEGEGRSRFYKLYRQSCFKDRILFIKVIKASETGEQVTDGLVTDDYISYRNSLKSSDIFGFQSYFEGEWFYTDDTELGYLDENNIEIQESEDFINPGNDAFQELDIDTFHEVNYILQEDKGDAKSFVWLRELLPTQEKLNVSEALFGMEYKIIFQLEGNHLILYKVSTNLRHIPYTEWTSVAETSLDSEKHFMVPFISYPIEYCTERTRIEDRRDLDDQEPFCQDVASEEAEYIRIKGDLLKKWKTGGRETEKEIIYKLF